jgi:PAS domain S-box-containing protein
MFEKSEKPDPSPRPELEAEIAARQSAQAMLAAIVESSDDAIIGQTLEGIVLSWNQGAEALLEYTAHEMMGQSILRIVPPERMDEEGAVIQRLRHGERVIGLETVRIAKGGRRLDVSLMVSPITDERGAIIGASKIARDIGARKRAEQALKESQERLEGIIGSATDAIITVDAGQHITLFNAAAERMFQCATADAIGKPLDKFIPMRFRETHRAHIERFGETGVTARAMGAQRPLAALRSDGSEFPVEATISQISVAGQKLYTAIVRDVSERHRQEEALLESEARLRAIVETAVDGIITIDDRGTVGSFNPAAERIFRYSPGEVIGRNVNMLMPAPYHQEHDRYLADYQRTGIKKIIGIGREVVGRRKDGSTFPMDLAVSETRLGPRTIYTGIVRDISERKRAEQALAESQQRLEGIIRSATDAIITVNEEQHITLFNAAAERMFMCAASDAIGSPLDRFIPAMYRAAHREHIHRFSETGATARVMGPQRPLAALRADGAEFPVEATISQTSVGGHRLFTAIVRDITERKRAEEEREHLLLSERAARSEAERISRMKDEFLATLSHELRTPLNAIYGWSQLLQRKSVQDEEIIEGLSVIARNARAQTQLIEDLLDMSRIISGKLRLDVQRTQMADVVDAAVQAVLPAAQAKEIRLQKVVDPLAGPVTGDPNRLQQVVWNLLSNAVKFTPRGGRIQVVLERQDSHLELSVADTGEGIRPEFLPYLFERFRQADASTTRRHGGLGLGLAIVKHLVELHGGSVRVRSGGVGQGSTFTVSLPLRAVVAGPETEALQVSARALWERDPEVHLHGLKALVVDDEADARDLIRRLLEEAGAEVLTAGSAAEAIDALRDYRADVLLSDIGMPEEDGYSLIRRVRRLAANAGGNLPAIALTAFARAEDRRRALLSGFQMHLAKPIEPAELIAVVANVTRRI